MPSNQAPEMLCHTWLLGQSYILCDYSKGFPIVYASTDFAELFDTYPLQCLHKKCGALVGIESIRANDPSLAACTGACGLGFAEVGRAMGVLSARAASAVKQMIDAGSGSFVTLNRTSTGSLFPVAVVMHTLRHEASGRRYCIGFQRAIADAVTLRDVMTAALKDEDVAANHQQGFASSCRQLLERSDVRGYLDLTMGGVWWPAGTNTLQSLGRRGNTCCDLPNPDTSCGDGLRWPDGKENSKDDATDNVMMLHSSGANGEPGFVRQCSFGTAASGGSLSSRRGLSLAGLFNNGKGATVTTTGSTGITNNSVSNASNDAGEGLQNAVAAGYVLGAFLAHSQLNRASKVMHARRGDRKFALKYADDRDGSLSVALQAEYEILRKLAHPGIVCAVDFFEARAGSVMVMELVPGAPLSRIMGELQWSGCHQVLTRLFGVVDYLHSERSVSHRDIKAENIMACTARQTEDIATVKLIDFGSARGGGDSAREAEEARLKWSSKMSCSSGASSFHDDIDVRILPPARRGGRGNDFELDVFAVGLVAVGLLVRRETFTSSVYSGCRWKMKLPQVSPTTLLYVKALLNPSPSKRPDMKAARQGLPAPEAWLLD